jgi:signal transduction histidine kinase
VAAARGRALEQAAESRARFTRGISHDLKNPLGAIDGHAALLELEVHGPIADAQRHALGRIRGSVRALLALVDDLLALARAEAGELRVTPRPTDVHALVREVADEHRAAATAAGLALDVQVDDELPELVTDPARVRQVLGNLLSNAVKYTPRGGTVAVAACVERDGDVECVRVRVADTGPGIPADQREQVFAEFVRLPGTTAPGSGLGLAIARRIARLLGGELWVDPGRARGACFVLELPAAAAVERVPVSAREHGSRSF